MKRTKYNNKKYYYDGYCFDSKKEHGEYLTLKHRSEKLHEFKLIVKPIFELVPKFKCQGKGIRRATIQPDFMLIWPEDKEHRYIYEVQDVKGFSKKKNAFLSTEKWKLQWKMLQYMAHCQSLCVYEYKNELVTINRMVEWKFTIV